METGKTWKSAVDQFDEVAPCVYENVNNDLAMLTYLAQCIYEVLCKATIRFSYRQYFIAL